MKNTVFTVLLFLLGISSLQAQYYGSSEWANDMMNYTNMAMFINANTINLQNLNKYSSEESADLAKVKPVTFQHTGKQLFLAKVKANVGNSEEQQKSYKIYSTLMQESLKRYEAYVRQQKMNPYDLGLAVAMLVETTYALSHDKHMPDEQVLNLSRQINQKIGKDAKMAQVPNEKKQLMYELLIGPQLVNYVVYEQAKKENDSKTANQMKQQGLALYKIILGSDFPQK